MSNRSIYLIGSLRNVEVPVLADRLRLDGHDVFDDWYSAGPEADDYWQRYEKSKGNTLPEALRGYAASHVFEFDKRHLERCDTAVLALPAGRSGHLELGFAAGRNKDCAILMEGEPDRYDVMYSFANLGVFYRLEDLLNELGKPSGVGGDGSVFSDRTCLLGT